MSDENKTTEAQLIDLKERRMRKKSEMLWMKSQTIHSLLAGIYILFILIVVSMVTGCKTSPDANLCVVVYKQGETFAACKNLKSKEYVDVPLSEMHKWIATDPDSYEAIRQWYKSGCN